MPVSVLPSPLGPVGDPYPAMFGQPDQKALDRMVNMSTQYFREREKMVVGQLGGE
jgi:D-psicose/D-tagatose/L-ribulose 3-epimerase